LHANRAFCGKRLASQHRLCKLNGGYLESSLDATMTVVGRPRPLRPVGLVVFPVRLGIFNIPYLRALIAIAELLTRQISALVADDDYADFQVALLAYLKAVRTELTASQVKMLRESVKELE
jgi:hypothetical protein